MNEQDEQPTCHLLDSSKINYSKLLDADDEVVLLDFEIYIEAENKRSLDIGAGPKSFGSQKFKAKELREICFSLLGRVDKRDSHRRMGVIQAGIYDGDQLGTRPDVGRRVGVL